MNNKPTQNRPPVGAPSSLNLHNSSADRAAHIPIDTKRRRKYDLERKAILQCIIRCFSFGIPALALGVWLVCLLQWWTIPLGALALWFGGWLLYDIGCPIRYLNELETYFWDSLLIGSVVVRRDPLTVLGLTELETGTDKRTVYRYFDGQGNEISQELYAEKIGQAQAEWDRTLDAEFERLYEEGKEEEADALWEDFWSQPQHTFSRKEDDEATERAKIWGCKLCVVGDGDWERRYKRGDRLPCSSIYGAQDHEVGIWRSMNILPLVWGTDNTRDLQACIEAIDESEWRMLEELAPLSEGLDTDVLYRIYREPEGAPTKYRMAAMSEDQDRDKKSE